MCQPVMYNCEWLEDGDRAQLGSRLKAGLQRDLFFENLVVVVEGLRDLRQRDLT